jgi:4-hydroxy-tetrahydrodipicolinate reductase
MKIALLGYGRMGKMIEQIALNRGHQVPVIADTSEDLPDLSAVDVAIDFSMPSAAFNNIVKCLNAGTPIICGTTGWLDKYDEAVAYCKEKQGAFMYASNYSLGVNLFFKLNRYLAKLMAPYTDYKSDVTEIHHTKKLDAPSGTAITLAEGVIEAGNYKEWELDTQDEAKLNIHSIREGEVPGTHTIAYDTPIDSIQISHIANNREGFALGAVIAAEWIIGKSGVFSMEDVIDEN